MLHSLIQRVYSRDDDDSMRDVGYTATTILYWITFGQSCQSSKIRQHTALAVQPSGC